MLAPVEIINLSTETLLIGAAAWGSYEKIKDFVKDRFAKEEKIRIKSTRIKDIIREDFTETTKIRQIHIVKSLDEFDVDSIPAISDHLGDFARNAVIKNHYSMPGRTSIIEDRFRVSFKQDEEPRSGTDIAFVMGYLVNEKFSTIHSHPSVTIRGPVGTDLLTYEAHILVKCPFVKVPGEDRPLIRVFTTKKRRRLGRKPRGHGLPLQDRRELEEGNDFSVYGGPPEDFNDGCGKTDWFRVIVRKPRQNCNYIILWNWVNATPD